MNNATLTKVGTIFYALVIGFFGINHFLEGTGMQKMVPSFLPGGVIWVYLTGACLIAAAIAFLIGKQVRLAGLLLMSLSVADRVDGSPARGPACPR